MLQIAPKTKYNCCEGLRELFTSNMRQAETEFVFTCQKLDQEDESNKQY